MQAPDDSSSSARSALVALAADLNLAPIIVARALEYAFDNLRAFPSASQALCFGIVRQSHYVDTQLMDLALQRLRIKFGVTLSTPAVQYAPTGQLFARSSTPSYRHDPNTTTTAPIQASTTAVSTLSPHLARLSDSGGYPKTSIESSFPHVGSWPVPQSRFSNS